MAELGIRAGQPRADPDLLQRVVAGRAFLSIRRFTFGANLSKTAVKRKPQGHGNCA